MRFETAGGQSDSETETGRKVRRSAQIRKPAEASSCAATTDPSLKSHEIANISGVAVSSFLDEESARWDGRAVVARSH